MENAKTTENEKRPVDRQKVAVRKAIDRIRLATLHGLSDARTAAKASIESSSKSMDVKSVKEVELVQGVFEKAVKEALLPLLAELENLMSVKGGAE